MVCMRELAGREVSLNLQTHAELFTLARHIHSFAYQLELPCRCGNQSPLIDASRYSHAQGSHQCSWRLESVTSPSSFPPRFHAGGAGAQTGGAGAQTGGAGACPLRRQHLVLRGAHHSVTGRFGRLRVAHLFRSPWSAKCGTSYKNISRKVDTVWRVLRTVL